MKLSNASQPTCTCTCTSTSGEVHHVYMCTTCPDAGSLLSPLNIAIICVCVSVIVFVQVCMRCLVSKFCSVNNCEQNRLYHYKCFEPCVKHYSVIVHVFTVDPLYLILCAAIFCETLNNQPNISLS